jgi:putative two-component system response regulator
VSERPQREDRILMVDDEPGNVLVLTRLLEHAGYRNVVSTTDPTNVERLYGEFQPDIILLDLHMPVLDGFAVMRRLSSVIEPDDYVPILVLTADVTQKSRQAALRSGAKDFITKPFDHAEVLARVGNLLDTRSLHRQLRRHNEYLEEKVRERTVQLGHAIARLTAAETDRRLAQEDTIHRLSRAAEFRDDETSRHIERMSRYCAILAVRAGKDERRAELLRTASKMHDIGKLGIPDAILLKPGRLSPEEYEVMKGHAEIGYQILQGSRSEPASTGAMLAWTHHERIDGTGYPHGLAGDEIPIEGRIAAIADVFDALTTDRIYKRAFPLPEALSVMRTGRGTHFDAELLDLFLDSLGQVLAAKEELADLTRMARPPLPSARGPTALNGPRR